MSGLVDLVLHLDSHLAGIIADYGVWTHGILFAVIFLETGVVVTPFLPGDSLLFAAGTLAATGSLHIWWLAALLFVAAVLGDTVNYWIGHLVGPKVFEKDRRWLKRKHLERTHAFYEKHGAKMIVLARFVPIVRTFAPFVAGVGRMHYATFLTYNIVGGLLWTGIFLFGGYLFGNIPIVQDNFGIVVIAIVAVSLLPMAVEFIKARKENQQAGSQ